MHIFNSAHTCIFVVHFLPITVEEVDFQVLNKILNFTSQDGKHEITVSLTDTGVSGRMKSFVLCLNVSNDTLTKEQRADLAEPSCITVYINNTYCKLHVRN